MQKLAIRYSILSYIFLFFLLISHNRIAYGYEIDIIGSEKFIQQVTLALNLLREQAPQEYEMVRNYIGRIEESDKSEMCAYKDRPVFRLSPRTAFNSVTWCAGVIVHDAYHSKLYNDNKYKYVGDVPYDVWAGFESEKQSAAIQLTALKNINAPQREIEHCMSHQDGTFADVNKDGKIDKSDYELRDW